jgi:pyruvate dehydrogenase E2 component (dihydrolipoamide acetyltransferase)
MVEIMTDKATVTITAPKAGTILETRGKVGGVVLVHSALVVFDLAGGATEPAGKAPPATTAASADGPAATAVGAIQESLPGVASLAAAAPRISSSSGTNALYFNDKPLATPATRKVARDRGVDLRHVPPTGPQGRVTKADVEGFRVQTNGGGGNGASLAGATPQAHAPSREAVKITAPTALEAAREERVPFAGMRRKIANKMALSTRTAAHFTFVEECDVSALKSLRQRLKPAAEAQGVKLSFLPFIVKATVAALKKHPILNSALDESTQELVYRKYFNIGIAASTDAGLIVPVVKDCDRKTILEIGRDIERLAADAKAAKSRVEDLSGSTFTITSLGSQGGLFATPIINFPEVGILGVHQIKTKPVVRGGEIAIGEVMLLSLSFDHRIVDGHVGAAFAYEIIAYLQEPERLFLEMA